MNLIPLITAFGGGSVVTVVAKTILQKRSDWRKVWAADFLERANEFNRLVSKISY